MTHTLPELLSKIEFLMQNASYASLYDDDTYRVLTEQLIRSASIAEPSVYMPLETTHWSDHFIRLGNMYGIESNSWPAYSTYYGIDVIQGRVCSNTFLFGGLALLGDQLFRSVFFVLNGVAIDPLAAIHNITADCYFGIPISISSIHIWKSYRERDKHILEIHVQKLKTLTSS